MARSTGSQKAERLNAAHGLLARGLSVAEACVSLSRQFALSRRQAYRYLQEAQALQAPLPVAEPSMAVTFKLPPSLVSRVRARAAADETTLSETVARALSAYLAGHGA
jgi:predicted DNA-binding transcriptional regulator YafY